jgi:hypothetical protein
MNKQVFLAVGVLSAFLLTGAAVVGIRPAYAEEDEKRGEGTSGTVETGRENTIGGGEFGDDDDDSERASIGGGLSGLILYGVIAAVVGTIGYTAYKIFVSRKKTSVQARSP